MEEGNFNTASTFLEGIEVKTGRVWKMLLSCYFTSHRFEEVVSTYEKMPAELQQDSVNRHVYLFASANLNHMQTAARIVEEALKEPDSVQRASFILRARPFAEKLGDEAHRLAVERILSHASLLAADQFDLVLKCAQDLSEKGFDVEALRLEADLRRVGGDARSSMKLELFEAQRHFRNGRYDLQLAAVNNVLSRQGTDPITLRDESAPVSCDNLKARPGTSSKVGGPLVSILVPAYNCAGSIGYVLESLCAQTYRDLEIIVVDDASPDATAQLVAQVSATDPRVRLISLARNSGAFVARNTALAAATGEFVTNQDADDWAHPQKIATAVAELQREESIVATWVEHLRCSKERGFRALNGYFRPDASSLMFRRDRVLERIGWYDSVRAAGDGEFHLRMVRAFGSRSIGKIEKLLSFVSWSQASLSGGGVFQIDDDMGLFSPVRSAYRRSFGLWHETTDALYMPFPLENRPFSVPERLLS